MTSLPEIESLLALLQLLLLESAKCVTEESTDRQLRPEAAASRFKALDPSSPPLLFSSIFRLSLFPLHAQQSTCITLSCCSSACPRPAGFSAISSFTSSSPSTQLVSPCTSPVLPLLQASRLWLWLTAMPQSIMLAPCHTQCITSELSVSSSRSSAWAWH